MSEKNYEIIQGNCITALRDLPEKSVHCCVTSPPYFGLRDYGAGGDEIGQEETVNEYVEKMVEVFREVHRVLRDDGTLWLNLGDSYMAAKNVPPPPQTIGGQRGMPSDFVPGNRRDQEGLKTKDLIGIPWRVAFALQADGWYLRQDIIWHKPNPMPESVADRCTKAHEYIFLFSKKAHYYFDNESVKEPAAYANCGRPSAKKGSFVAKGEPMEGQLPFRAITETRNKRSVWTVNTRGYKGAHFATFPEDLILPCVRAGTSERGCCSKCGAPHARQSVSFVENLEPTEPIYRKEIQLTPEDSAIVIWLEKNGGDYRISVDGEKHSENWKDIPMSNGRRGELQRKGYTLFHWNGGKSQTEWAPTCRCDGAGVEPCTVLDPFNGAATTGVVALKEGRRYVGIELNPEYIKLSKKRIEEACPPTLMEIME